jgi:hypothetical protein
MIFDQRFSQLGFENLGIFQRLQIYTSKDIYPCELAEIIYEAHIVFKSTSRLRSSTPNIRKNKLKRLRGNTGRHRI